MEYLDEQLFTWSRWRSGSPADIGLICRENIIISNKERIKQLSVGFCDADKLVCRPKENQKAIMFFKDGYHFWFHLTNKEFKAIYET
jgi:hypothetical protein